MTINIDLKCPSCKVGRLEKGAEFIRCKKCGVKYKIFRDSPVLVQNDSDIWDWYSLKNEEKKGQNKYVKSLLKNSYKYLSKKLKPETERRWSSKSKSIINKVLNTDGKALLTGSGFEPVFARNVPADKKVIKAGLPHTGNVDIYCDLHNIPIADNEVDQVISSSVLEHVEDSNRVVEEICRVLSTNGNVYAEVPFLRAYHMEPHDYRRYTISGVKNLFEKKGFETIDIGISSGPFTSLVLIAVDSIDNALPDNKYVNHFSRLVPMALLGPFRHLDAFVEDSEWATYLACNFYYFGRKV